MNRRSIFKSIVAAFIAPKAASALPSSQSIPSDLHKFDPVKWDGAVTWINTPDSFARKTSLSWEDKH